jgi:hypothetical protein
MITLNDPNFQGVFSSASRCLGDSQAEQMPEIEMARTDPIWPLSRIAFTRRESVVDWLGGSLNLWSSAAAAAERQG